MTQDNDAWVTNDPELICMVNVENPQCGRACLPITEYMPLMDEIARLRAEVTRLREVAAHAVRVLSGTD